MKIFHVGFTVEVDESDAYVIELVPAILKDRFDGTAMRLTDTRILEED